MGRRRSVALRDIAGAHHAASRLSREGFRAAVGPGAGGAHEVLAGLPQRDRREEYRRRKKDRSG